MQHALLTHQGIYSNVCEVLSGPVALPASYITSNCYSTVLYETCSSADAALAYTKLIQYLAVFKGHRG